MRRRALLSVPCFLLAAATLRAQAPAAPGGDAAAAAAASDAAVHDALRAVKTKAVEAIAAGDVDRLTGLLAREVVVTWQNAEVCRGPAAVKAYYDRMMKGPSRIVEKVTVAPEVDTLSVLYGGDTAIAYGSSTDGFKLASGLEFSMKSRWSATLVLEDGAWKIASFHASTNLFDNPLLASAKKGLWLAGGGGVAVGLLVGFLAFRRKG